MTENKESQSRVLSCYWQWHVDWPSCQDKKDWFRSVWSQFARKKTSSYLCSRFFNI